MDTLVRMLRSSSTRAIVCFIVGVSVRRPLSGRLRKNMAADCGGLRLEGERIMTEGDAGFEARRLLRAARAGTLATSAEGQPFASLVTPACAGDGSVLLLLS